MTRIGTALAVVLLLGCASDKQTDAPGDMPRGQRRRLDGEQQPAAQPVAEPVAPEPVLAAEAAKPAPEEAKPPEKEKRDYDAELLAAIGSPVHCLKPRTGLDVPKEIAIDVDATVVELGMVTRAYARSPQLDEEELECVQRQLATLRMRAPIEAAPRSVHTTIKLELQPSARAAAPEAPDAYGQPREPTPANGTATEPTPAQ